MAKYSSKQAALYMSTSGAAVAVPLPGTYSFTINKTTDRVEVTAFGDGTKSYVQSFPDVQGDFAVRFDDTDDSYFDAAESTTAVKIYAYPSRDAPTIYHYGTAWVDASMECTVDGAVNITGSFAAASAWARKP
ncbi:MAG: hypothetical protein VW405_00840 [Rhodospirillaceae bacterium]